jgi:VanZ family protein
MSNKKRDFEKNIDCNKSAGAEMQIDSNKSAGAEKELSRHSCPAPNYIVTAIDIIIALAIMVVIFHFSAQNATESSALSDGIAYRIIDAIRKIIPGLTMDEATFAIRKTAHFSEYTLLGVFLARTARDIVRIYCSIEYGEDYKMAWRGHWLCIVPWCLGTMYAISDELHQLVVPGRSCELRDMCIDAAGVLLGVILVRLATKCRKS